MHCLSIFSQTINDLFVIINCFICCAYMHMNKKYTDFNDNRFMIKCLLNKLIKHVINC